MPVFALRSSFVNDFVVLEKRAMQEYENYWDMRVLDVNVIPRHLIKPFTMEETALMAWQMYAFLRKVSQSLFHPNLGRMLLVITETEWSITDKLFEMQKLFAKLPKEIFLVLKCTLTHLCRLSVAHKTEPHYFRPLSNIFAPILFRIPSRANSIYQEELYLTEHPSVIRYSDDSLDAECDDSSGGGEENRMDDFRGENAGDHVSGGLYDFSSNRAENEMEIESEVVAPPEVHAPAPSISHTVRTHRTQRTTGGSIRVPRSVITSKYSSTTKGPEIENLWNNPQDEAPSVEEGIKQIPGFKSDPVIRERTVLQPDLSNVEIPKESPFNKTRLEEAAMADQEEEEEFEFDDWVLKQMQEAARAYKVKKGGAVQAAPIEPVETASAVSADPAVSESQNERSDQREEAQPVQSDAQPTSTEQAPQTNAPKIFKPTIDMQDEADSFEYAGIRIEICEVLEADIYIAKTVTEKPTTDHEMSSLLAVLDTPMDLMFASDAFAIERLPMVVSRGSSDTEVDVVVPDLDMKKGDELAKSVKLDVTGKVDYGEGDPDGFGWNLMTKRSLASQLFLGQECQCALAACLELIIKNVDVLFDYNTHIVAERSAKLALQDKKKSEVTLGMDKAIREF
ncbi:hypothetical protein BC830DRAFT_56442 [Chytriomyces sp. MP71]|nr:hypothetical protein BC830DRAFT_56442 [Chytriomyces sp. MP71]